MTETKRRKKDSVESLEEQIEAMEAELAAGYGKPLSWEEVTSTTADEIAKKEQRRGVLPRLIHAARVRRLELEVGRCENEVAPRLIQIEETYASFLEEEEALRCAQEKRDAAHGEWNLALSALQSAEDRTKRTKRELRELKESA